MIAHVDIPEDPLSGRDARECGHSSVSRGGLVADFLTPSGSLRAADGSSCRVVAQDVRAVARRQFDQPFGLGQKLILTPGDDLIEEALEPGR